MSFENKKKVDKLILEFNSTKINPNEDDDTSFVESLQDITEKVLVDESLLKSEKRFKALVKNGADLTAIVDPEGNYLYISPNYQSILGYTEKDLIGKNAFDFLHMEDLEILKTTFAKLHNQKRIKIPPFRFKNKMNGWSWMQSIGTNLVDDATINGYVINSIEVTDLIETQQALNKSNERFEMLMKSGSESIWDYDLEEKEFFLSDGFYENFGIKSKLPSENNDLINSLIHPSDKSKMIASFRKTLGDASKFEWKFNYRILKSNGEYAHVRDKAVILRNKKGEAYRAVGAIKDITSEYYYQQFERIERDVFEISVAKPDQLKEVLTLYISELEAIFPEMKASILSITNNKIFNIASPSLPKEYIKTINGLTIGNNVGSCGTAAYKKEKVIVSDIFNDVRWSNYHDLAKKYGFKSCWSYPIFNSKNEVIATFANYYATVRHPSRYEEQAFERAEKFLSLLIEKNQHFKDIKKSNHRFELINSISEDAIYEWDILKDNFYWSNSFQTTFGHDIRNYNFSRQNWMDLIHPEDYKEFNLSWEKFINEQKKTHWSYEFRIKNANDTYSYVEDNANVIRSENGLPISVIGVLKDITSSRLNEFKKNILNDISILFNENLSLKAILIKALEYLTSIDNFSLAEIWLVNQNKNELNLISKYAKSKEARKFHEKSKTINKVKIDEGLPGKVFKSREVALWDDVKNNINCFLRKDEIKVTPFSSALGLPIFHNNEPIGTLILMSEFSANKIEKSIFLFQDLQIFLGAEIRRKQKEEEMFFLFDSSPDILAIASSNGYFTKVNRAFCKLLGMSEEEIVSVPFETFVHPSDILESQKEYKETINGERNSSNFINRYRTKSGNYRWISWSLSDVFDEDGNVFAYGRDVTEFVKIQNLLNNAAQLAKVGGWELDVLNQKLYWSPMSKLIAEVEEDFQPQLESILQFYREDYRDIINTCIIEAINMGNSFDVEAVIVTPNKKQKWVRVIGNSEFLNGRCLRLFGSFQDITETKVAELELEKKNNYLSSITSIVLELMNSTDTNETLENIFKIMGETVNVDRVYFFEIDENKVDGLLACSQIIKWTNDGMPTEINNPKLQNMILEDYQEYFRLLEKGKIVTELTSTLPDSQFKQLMESQNIQSFLFFPIFVFDRFYGFIGFDDCTTERIWSEAEISFLSSVTFHLSSKIQSRIVDLQTTKLLEERNNILESIDDAFISLDKNWNVKYWNKKVELLSKIGRDEIIGNNFWKFFPHLKNSIYEKYYRKALIKNTTVNFQNYDNVLKLWLHVSAYPSKKGLSVYIKDITDYKKYEEELKLSNERFEISTLATNDAIWDYDITDNLLYWSKGFSALFQYNIDKILPTFDFFISCIHPEDREVVSNKIERNILDQSVTNWFEEFRFIKSDGTYAFVMNRAILIRDKNGKAIRAIGAITDITYRKEYENSLMDLNEKLKKQAEDLAFSNRELEQFAFVASHDLQEPLRMVTNFLSQLEKKYKDQLDEKAAMYIHYAVDGAKRMRQIILDILAFSRIGKSNENMEYIDLNQIVNVVILFQNQTINEKNAIIKIDKLPIIYNHITPIKQIFQNLISNALKYAKADEYPRIEITVEEFSNDWQFSIKDNGIGISAEYFDKIFEIFQRLHVRDEYSGTGIGLSIVKKILENIGGKIWVESKEGEGSTFTFLIPKNSLKE